MNWLKPNWEILKLNKKGLLFHKLFPPIVHSLAAYPHMWCEEITIEYTDNIALITECNIKLFGLLGIDFGSAKLVWNTWQLGKIGVLFNFIIQELKLLIHNYYILLIDIFLIQVLKDMIVRSETMKPK